MSRRKEDERVRSYIYKGWMFTILGWPTNKKRAFSIISSFVYKEMETKNVQLVGQSHTTR